MKTEKSLRVMHPEFLAFLLLAPQLIKPFTLHAVKCIARNVTLQ